MENKKDCNTDSRADSEVVLTASMVSDPNPRSIIVSRDQLCQIRLLRNGFTLDAPRNSHPAVWVSYQDIAELTLEDDGLHLSSPGKRLHLAVESRANKGHADYPMTAILMMLINSLRQGNATRVARLVGVFKAHGRVYRIAVLGALVSVLAAGVTIGVFHEAFILNPRLFLILVPLGFSVPIALYCLSRAMLRRALSGNQGVGP